MNLIVVMNYTEMEAKVRHKSSPFMDILNSFYPRFEKPPTMIQYVLRYNLLSKLSFADDSDVQWGASG
jgi:hypothetical protein